MSPLNSSLCRLFLVFSKSLLYESPSNLGSNRINLLFVFLFVNNIPIVFETNALVLSMTCTLKLELDR